jgi:hypothetical protein
MTVTPHHLMPLANRKAQSRTRALTPFGFVRGGRVVHVALGRLEVAVAEPRLDCGHGLAGPSHRRAKGMPEIVEPKGRIKAGGGERGALAAHHWCARDRSPGDRVPDGRPSDGESRRGTQDDARHAD